VLVDEEGRFSERMVRSNRSTRRHTPGPWTPTSVSLRQTHISCKRSVCRTASAVTVYLVVSGHYSTLPGTTPVYLSDTKVPIEHASTHTHTPFVVIVRCREAHSLVFRALSQNYKSDC